MNYTKSNFIVVSHRNQTLLNSVHFGSSQIYSTNNVKFLGMTIDKNLKFNDHVDVISHKIATKFRLIYRVNKKFSRENFTNFPFLGPTIYLLWDRSVAWFTRIRV